MRRRRLVPLLASAGALGAGMVLAVPGADAARGCRDADLAAGPGTAQRVLAAVGCLVDGERTSRGLPALAQEARLARAAGGHARAMADGGFFGHEGPDGSTPGSRARAAGYDPGAVGETLGGGQRTPRALVAAWMASPPHCAALLDHAFTELGLGVAGEGDGLRWVNVLARPRGAGAPAGDGAGARPQDAPAAAIQAPAPGPAQAPPPAPAARRGARLTFRVTRLRGGKARVRGTLTGAGRGTVRIEVRRGTRRTTRVVRTRGRFDVRVRATRGDRLRVSAAGVARLLVLR